ncbi:hypothetical protein BAUCODRAFT_27918 [Baudoinia panamericana UAMH 10762]|uniref:Cell morphogenesis protein N-terminal domain-containing protein n=1 Tax=Baudoinia panamericana (strain UAMH 10762) TaxID=717646 RepID=M2MJY4_BAUPA|nr:uncharacterized protein BAUCODRAFT_27918 [Baudoinia panamericana UAMH 10762]EMC91638.1 hypothetical protein BAUCODRAFT_27918 [Baudoinia panamericana UAMH 10762]
MCSDGSYCACYARLCRNSMPWTRVTPGHLVAIKASPAPVDTRALFSLTSSDLSSSPPPEPLLVAPPAPFATSRDHSATRGRALSATSPHNASPRGVPPAQQAPQVWTAKQSLEIDRKASLYNHHRQTSIVNGAQHSRNPSLAAPTHRSPLGSYKATANGSPETATANGNAVLKKSPSMTTLYNNGTNGTSGGTATVVRGLESHPSQRRPQRMHSGRVKTSSEHQRAQSRAQAAQEPKTVGEYALHHLFTSFVAEADERIERCIPRFGELEPRIEEICGPGADPPFDQLISSLGHINRHKPKSLIDSVIHWRKMKADLANKMYSELQLMREPAQVTQRPVMNGISSAPTSPPGGQEVLLKEHEVSMADRRSTISIYLLCRVLIAIISQTTLEALNGPDGFLNTAGRLEEVIYGQLQSADPDMLATSPVLSANWVIRGQLLGVMSGIRFEAVTDRFLQNLEIAQEKLSVKGQVDPRLAAKTARLVQSMRFLKVQLQPQELWEASCRKLLRLAKFFAAVHGRVMKHAYAELFEHLLLPVAAKATSEFDNPSWREALVILQLRTSQMLSKADHWPYVYPLQAVLLCVSPQEQFASQWLALATSVPPKARDRAGRSHMLKAVCRLTWRYLYRPHFTDEPATKKLDDIVKLVFQGGKRAFVSTDPAIADPLIQLIRIIGYKHQDICFRTIIFPLMNSELFEKPEKDRDKDLRIESLDPEKTVVAIRAFLAIMTDLEKGQAPPFPTRYECDDLMDPASRSPITHRRTRSQGFAVSAGRTERLSRPVMTTNFNDVTKEYFDRFCKILGKITTLCDEAFGGQAVLKEKTASQTPKTPMAEAFAFNKKEDLLNPTDARQHYYDLLHVAVEALPRCLSPVMSMTSLVNLLCTGTAHVQPHIASSSAQSLRSIARQAHAQQVTTGFYRFVFNFDDPDATAPGRSLLGPEHIENTLKLYVELLQIWVEEVEHRTRKARADQLSGEDVVKKSLHKDSAGLLAHVDEVESHGLFLLCSPSRTVRAAAVDVLQLITKFDTAIGKPGSRLISILQGGSQQVIDVNDERLSLAERSRLQKGLRRSSINSTLVEMCSSDLAHDTNLWFKLFPNLIRLSSKVNARVVALTRALVCKHLWLSNKTIKALSDGSSSKLGVNSMVESASVAGRPFTHWSTWAPDMFIEQWRIHLVFACTTLTEPEVSGNELPLPSQSSQHTRKSSRSSTKSQAKITTAQELLKTAVPYLSSSNATLRDAATSGLGSINATLYDTLLDSLKSEVGRRSGEGEIIHQRSLTSLRRSPQTDCLRTEITRLLGLTCHHLADLAAVGDATREMWFAPIAEHGKQLRLFLSETDIQGDLEFQRLRTHYCVFIEALYDSIQKLKRPSYNVAFQWRQAIFALMEDWCGFSPHEPQLRRHEAHLRRSVLDREQDLRNRGIMSSTMEKERNDLQLAALSAMATLCAGPLGFFADNKILMQFDVRRLLAWVGAIFEAQSDRMHAIGRRALLNLILHNQDQPYLMAQAMRMCYIARTPKALTSYFEVVTKVLTDCTGMTVPFWKILCAGLYTLGNEDSGIRMKSARLLRALEERQKKTSKLQDLDISVSDKTTAVYKLAQFEISRRLSKQHPELAFHVFSEFSMYFNELQPDHQRNMVSGMLPWIQTTELQVDPSGAPTATSHMLLVNLFEITIKSSITLHNEIQALWQALATGPYAGNVQVVLHYIIGTCLERKEHNFVLYAKQVVVFLSKTPAGARVVEYLLLQICPRTMVPEQREPIQPPVDITGLPYIADLNVALPSGARQNSLSLGQLSMILLVDLIVSPIKLPPEKVPSLLQVVLVQWDQYVPIVQEQARELLVHLIHELVISRIEPGSTKPDKRAIEDFIESVRRHDPKIAWSYSDSEISSEYDRSRSVSDTMNYVVDEVVKIFCVTYPGLREEWGRVTMQWATSCAVRHIACRSFQVFRCIQTTLDQQMLADMLARLSNTIADSENPNYLIFSLEILATLRSIVDALTPIALLQYPQLFWTTCACLDTIFEREYQEALTILDIILRKMDLTDPAVVRILKESQPSSDNQSGKWEGAFNGLHCLIYKGMRSSRSMDRSLAVMEILIKLPSNEILGLDDRLAFTVLANLPRYLHAFEEEPNNVGILDSARTLSIASEGQGCTTLAGALEAYASGQYRSSKDFLAQILQAIRQAFFPALEFRSLVFLLGMVNNQTDWFKVRTMQILSVIVPEIDMRKPEIASQGPDLISPLLRLLQTEHCQQALDVLDNVIEMTGTPLDNKHLRMSMAGSHSSRATRKEYESTKSLYGIPEDSGWSIPMPAMHAAQTRANVHAVFYTLAYAGLDGTQEAARTPEIEFHKDEYPFDSYAADRTATMMSDDTRTDGNMGELAVKLDSLDDFFGSDEEGIDSTSPLRSDNVRPRYPSGRPGEREDLYEEQVRPILQSLQRNTSVTSFQRGFASSEVRYQPGRDMVMNPAAFAQNTALLSRPGLHNRAVTSPVMTLKDHEARQPLAEPMSGDEGDRETDTFSDDDLSIGKAHTGEDRALPQHNIKPSRGFRGWSQGLRRLTSSSGTQQEALKTLAKSTSRSPQVPRMPAPWLRNPQSAEP